MTDELTQFQRNAEHAIVALLSERGAKVDNREVLTATIPFYSSGSETIVRLVASELEVWLYPDEATLSHRGSDNRFERAAFDSTGQLMSALLECVSRSI
jgi:hypothetical protein